MHFHTPLQVHHASSHHGQIGTCDCMYTNLQTYHETINVLTMLMKMSLF